MLSLEHIQAALGSGGKRSERDKGLEASVGKGGRE